MTKDYKRSTKEFYILVSTKEQKLYLMKEGKPVQTFLVSTSKFGTGNREGSYQTPLGRHRIYQKIGANLPPGAILKGRKFTGTIVKANVSPDEDLITSRILWLEGLENGINRGEGVDTRKRLIYIHGTPHVELLGTPASKGCIRMKDEDIIELFDLVEEGTPVIIS